MVLICYYTIYSIIVFCKYTIILLFKMFWIEIAVVVIKVLMFVWFTFQNK